MRFERLLIFLLVASLAATSCEEYATATISIENQLGEVRISSFRMGDVSVYGSLLPGQSTDPTSITLLKEEFPIGGELEFLMTAGSNVVYLRTRESFQLNADQNLVITIGPDTEVYNPILE